MDLVNGKIARHEFDYHQHYGTAAYQHTEDLGSPQVFIIF